MIIGKRTLSSCLLISSTLLLSACEIPFLNDEQAKLEAKRQAEGMAVGSGCRYSGRNLEECYGMNPKTSKAAILNGWRDMDAYMRENNIVVAAPETGDAEKKSEGADAKPKAPETAAQAPKSPEAPKSAEAALPAGQAAPKRTLGTQGADQPKPLKHMI